MAPRTIALFDHAGSAPRQRLPAVLPLRWPDKPVASLLDYTLDATGLLADPAELQPFQWGVSHFGDPLCGPGWVSDALVSLTVNAVAGGLVLQASSITAGLAVLWLGGGVPGDCMVDVTIATASRRSVRRIVRLLVFA